VLLAAHRLLGELATDAGEYAAAEEHLDDALLLAEACAVPFERALTLLALAALRAATGKPTEAGALLAEVRAICTPLGATPTLTRATALAERLGEATAAMARHHTPAGALTPRELEVLHLIVAGHTNQQIADALSVSKNTVMRHVAHILAKTEAENRAAATAYALRHNLA
jgi:DNA-binding NarL/FixJ family response regulator